MRCIHPEVFHIQPVQFNPPRRAPDQMAFVACQAGQGLGMSGADGCTVMGDDCFGYVLKLPDFRRKGCL